MSTIDTGVLNAVLVERVPQLVKNVVVKRGTLIRKLMEDHRVPTLNPQGPRWQVETTSHSTAGTFSEDGSYPAASYASYTEASLGWAKYAATIRFSELTLKQLAAGADALTKVSAYVNQQTISALNDMIDEMDADARANDPDNGGDDDGLVGLSAIFSDTNEYAGIDRSTQSLWRAFEDTTASAPTKVILDNIRDTLVDDREGGFDMIFGSVDRCRDVAELTGAGIADAPRTTLNPDGTLTSHLGFGSASDRMKPWAVYDGAPVISIPALSTSVLYFMDTSELCFEMLDDIEITDVVKIQNAPQYAANVVVYCQMYHRNPFRGCGFASALT